MFLDLITEQAKALVSKICKASCKNVLQQAMSALFIILSLRMQSITSMFINIFSWVSKCTLKLEENSLTH